MRIGLLLALQLPLLCACGGGAPPAAESASPPAPLPATSPPKSFADGTRESNISYLVGYTLGYRGYRVDDAVSFGGAAAGDCDSDGDVDLFITYGDLGPNRLYINQLIGGTGVPLQFDDRAAKAGVAMTDSAGGHNDRHSGPTFADMDGDGDLDLFIGGLYSDPNKVYSNNGDCTFEDVTLGSGLESLTTDNAISSAFGDYDLDGDLDLFLTHWGSRDEFPVGGESEHLFRNVSTVGEIRFENASASSRVTEQLIAMRVRTPQAGIPDQDWTFTPHFARINDDLWPDIAIAADFGTAQLLINDAAAPGTFLDATNAAVRSVEYGMGSALGDIDFDGDLDWFITSIFSRSGEYPPGSGNRLLINPGGDFSTNHLEDVTTSAGIADGRWGWAACMLDIDNDTDLDIYHTNGWNTRGGDHSRVFVSDGNGRFTEQARELGLDDDHNSRGTVCADFDNDGDIDLLLLSNAEPNSAILWRNETAAAGRNFLRVRLIGLPANTEAAGARIFVRIGSRTQMREIMVGGNYTTQNPTVQVFGLGAAAAVDELRVTWPPSLPGPGQATPWVNANVSASTRGQTLVICHPDLQFPPQECSPSK